MSSGSESPRPQRSSDGRKRASKACSRCRRYRTKCVPLRPNKIGEAPCESCTSLRVESECVFLPRGQSAADRAHRRRPTHRESTGDYEPAMFAPSPMRPIAPPSPNTSSSPIQTMSEQRFPPSDELPPQCEVVEAIRNYVASYFQLGFLHKAIFVERYMTFPERVSEFLLLAICSIAAPFTPSLVSRYKGKKRATDFFLGRADQMLGKEMVEPSLERAQAFLLLGVTEWGQGNGSKAWMLIGTAVRMAGFLGLHRESTYHLPPNPAPETFIESEVASRASIAGILRGASGGYSSSTQGEKSLFASLVQVKILWSLTARQACRGSGRFEMTPWSNASRNLLTALQDFEVNLPIKHRFTVTNLRGMMVEGLDLAFLSITLITRLSNIVIRRMHLSAMANAIDPEGASERNYESHDFWKQMANEMVWNSEQLLSQVETFFGMRSVFGVYMCGNVFSYLWRWPELCLSRASMAQSCYRRCIDILAQLADSWPLASRWHLALQSTDQRPVRQPGLSRLRTAVQSERNFDDEMEDIYGRPAASIIGSSPDDRSAQTAQRGPFSTEAVQQQHFSPQPRQSQLSIPLPAQPLPQASNGIDFLAFPNPSLYPPAPSFSESNHLDLPGEPVENAAAASDFFTDTFGDDLSAFLQSAVPVGNGDDGIGQIFFGVPPRDSL
ncbi:hypothetical protein IAT40_008042 [Kwoniella sp. CBS 6097]